MVSLCLIGIYDKDGFPTFFLYLPLKAIKYVILHVSLKLFLHEKFKKFVGQKRS